MPMATLGTDFLLGLFTVLSLLVSTGIDTVTASVYVRNILYTGGTGALFCNLLQMLGDFIAKK